MSETQQPSVGRVVHTVIDGRCVPAIILRTFPPGPTVNIKIFTEEGDYITSANYSDQPESGCWHWPERV